MKRDFIALTLLGIENQLLFELMLRLDDDKDCVQKLFDGEPEMFQSMRWSFYKEIFDDKNAVKTAREQADHILEMNKIHGIHTIFCTSEEYPRNLWNIGNAPVILYYKGAAPNKSEKSIACVGSRKMTKFGMNAINLLVPQFVNEGFSIISGLAEGVDRMSHIACLAAGGNTTAVLAHGLDMIYPDSNRSLAEKILENGGTLLSEYPYGSKPDRNRFVARNRIISGCSKAVLVMECEKKSGTMHTVEFAVKQKRPVFCPDPGNNNISGLLHILDKGYADSLRNGRDIGRVISAAGYQQEKAPMSKDQIADCYRNALILNDQL